MTTYTADPLGNLRILLIDDDTDLLNSLKYYFEDHDCRVITASDGESGINLFNAENPELVLVDLNMPRVDGLSVVAHIGRHSPETPVIVVSGTGNIREVIRSMNLGAWDFVTKPIHNFEDLELSVHRALEKAFLIKENRNHRENLEKLVEIRTSELKKKSEELEDLVVKCRLSQEKAEKSEQLKTDFLTQISHEIRTPINTLLSYSSLLMEEVKEQSGFDIDMLYAGIETAGRRLIRTIDLILNMSQIQNKSYENNPRCLELNSLVEQQITAHKYQANSRELQINFIKGAEENEVVADEYALIQIVSNLLDNSIKFTPAGSVNISSLRSGSGKAVLEISDTGVGIEKEYLPYIFEPFTQESQGFTRRYDGNGLGLATVKKYCEYNNIDISITSEKNKGTVVKLVFNL